MKVYIFGNQDLGGDNIAFKVSKKLQAKVKGVEFVEIKPNQDLPFVNQKQVVLMDTVLGVNKVIQIKDKDLNKIILSKSLTVHDFDLGFQLKYLRKIGKLGKVMIIGLPSNEQQIDYSLIQSILRKLVAQDMQGS